jgi:hypothetical protein
MREIFYRAAKGTVFVPIGAVAASLLWLWVSMLVSLFMPRSDSGSLGEALLGFLGASAIVSIWAAFIALLFALAVGVPLLAVLIYARMDHWIVCGITGASCAALFAGLPQHWDPIAAQVIFAGAAGGIAGWFGSRPNPRVESDALARLTRTR